MQNSQTRFQQIINLLPQIQQIRNISIIAHVDHGKTTLSDQLISSNNIISKKLAGSLRYLDSRPDEQLRGITMKSSSISIVYSGKNQEQYLINLIDSPGHVDFSSEVSAALKLTDGALILIDVCEGFSSQTYTVLKQMFQEGIRGILVLNKIDRLINELRLTPLDAFTHLSQIIEQVNATLSSFLQQKFNDEENEQNDNREDNQPEQVSLDDNVIGEQEGKLYFSPEKDNIIFCSAIDSWAFTISDFASIYSKKLGLDQKALQKYLWGNYYIQPKVNKILKDPLNATHKPMFVELIAKNIWQIYEAHENKDLEKLSKMSKSVGVETSTTCSQLLSRWLPMDKVILQRVISILPCPVEAQNERIEVFSKKMEKFIEKYLNNPRESLREQYENYNFIHESLKQCSPDGPIIIFVSKMISIERELINEKGLDTQTSLTKFYAFARVFSGTLKRGSKVFVIGPKSKYYQSQSEQLNEIQEVQINNIYLMMAQNLEGIQQAFPGNIIAIGGLDDIVFKTATISSVAYCPSFTPVHIGALSLLKNTVKPQNIEDIPKLIQGLKKLNKADPSIEVFNVNGDIIIGTCGEIHLQRCVTDLEEKFANCKVKVSEPIISFKETIVYQNLVDESNQKQYRRKAKILQKDDQRKEQKEKKTKKKDTTDDVDKEDEIKRKQGLLLDKETEVVNTFEIIEEDIRYALLKPEHQENQFKYVKKTDCKVKQDHKNKGKANLIKFSYNEILDRSNLVEELTANQKVEIIKIQIEQIAIKVRAIGMPFELTTWLDQNQKLMQKLFYEQKKNVIVGVFIFKDLQLEYQNFITGWDKKMKEIKMDKRYQDLIENHLVCFGPKKHGPNMLICKTIKTEESFIQKIRRLAQGLEIQPVQEKQEILQQNEEYLDEQLQQSSTKETFSQNSKSANNQINKKKLLKYINVMQCRKYFEIWEMNDERILNSLAMGFDLALNSGPLCEETIIGLQTVQLYILIGACYIVEDIQYKQIQTEVLDKNLEQNKANQQDEEKESIRQSNEEPEAQFKSEVDPALEITDITNDHETYGPITGQIYSAMKDACINSFIGAQPRLVEAVYKCTIQTDFENYGKAIDVLGKRRAKVISETSNSSTSLLQLSVHLPVCSSFGVYSDLQIATSGRVSAQLEQDGWVILEIDPFYQPQTEEVFLTKIKIKFNKEVEENGAQMLQKNIARELIEATRKRKGLVTEIKVSAEKQRNIARKR